MTNYPTGPNRTTPHSTSYFLPPTPGQSLILSPTYTLQTCLIIDVPSVPTSIQMWRICYKAYSLLVSKVCAYCAELRYSGAAMNRNDQHSVHLITTLIIADRRWVDLIEFNWHCRQRSRGKVFRIGTVRYNWPLSAHASQAFIIAHCTN